MAEVRQIQSDRLSTFRTNHRFERYGEFQTVEEFLGFKRWAAENNVKLYILANGSNTLFIKNTIKTLVLRNRLKPEIEDLGDGRIKASSSLPIMRILKHCEKNCLDSFYFLASVPATVGGAIAMNAGGGTGPTILDFVESVTFVEGDQVVTVPVESLERSHRKTRFSGVQDALIVGATFKFQDKELSESEIKKRIEWCHENQDIRAPNCGSVFRVYHGPILRRFRRIPPLGIYYPLFRTQFSQRVNNWIITRNKRSWPIVFLIRFVQFVHRLFGKRAIPELIEVD